MKYPKVKIKYQKLSNQIKLQMEFAYKRCGDHSPHYRKFLDFSSPLLAISCIIYTHQFYGAVALTCHHSRLKLPKNPLVFHN